MALALAVALAVGLNDALGVCVAVGVCVVVIISAAILGRGLPSKAGFIDATFRVEKSRSFISARMRARVSGFCSRATMAAESPSCAQAGSDWVR